LVRVGVNEGGVSFVLVLLANRAFPDKLLDILANSGPIAIGFSLMNNIAVPRMAC
jgi:hypothetical protein